MNTKNFSAAITVILLTAGTGTASAGMLDSLKSGSDDASSGSSALASATGGTALITQLTTGSFNLGSASNVLGVLGYCQKQGYTQSATDQVKSQLMQKLGGQSAVEQDSGYQQGLSGVLQSDEGHQFTLANLKSSVGQRVCGMIAKKATSSFLGS